MLEELGVLFVGEDRFVNVGRFGGKVFSGSAKADAEFVSEGFVSFDPCDVSDRKDVAFGRYNDTLGTALGGFAASFDDDEGTGVRLGEFLQCLQTILCADLLYRECQRKDLGDVKQGIRGKGHVHLGVCVLQDYAGWFLAAGVVNSKPLLLGLFGSDVDDDRQVVGENPGGVGGNGLGAGGSFGQPARGEHIVQPTGAAVIAGLLDLGGETTGKDEIGTAL